MVLKFERLSHLLSRSFWLDSPIGVEALSLRGILNENINNKSLCPIGELNPKDRLDRWENLSNYFILLCGTDVRSYHSISFEKSDVRK